MTTCPAGADWTRSATWTSTSGLSPASTSSVTPMGATAWSAEPACTGISPSREYKLPVRTAASHSWDGERCGRRTAGSEHTRARIYHPRIRATQAPPRPWCISPASEDSSSARARVPITQSGRSRHAINAPVYLRHRHRHCSRQRCSWVRVAGAFTAFRFWSVHALPHLNA